MRESKRESKVNGKGFSKKGFSKEKKMGKKDVYEIVTDQFIKGLEKTGKWVQPYKLKGKYIHNLPMNYTTKRQYSGINLLITLMQGYECPYWITFKQCSKLGGYVRKGEKSTIVTYWKKYENVKKCVLCDGTGEKEVDGKIVECDRCKGEGKVNKDFWKLFYHRVFNLEQTTLEVPEDLKKKDEEEKVEFNSIKEAEKILENYSDAPTVKNGNCIPCYKPVFDEVELPEYSADNYISQEEYYSTLNHELVHSTGHNNRLNRKSMNDYNPFDNSRNYEELVAEIGSAFLNAITGIATEDVQRNSEAYVRGWVKKLTEKPKWIVMASSEAQKAVDYIQGK